MSDTVQLLVPFASRAGADFVQARATLTLPHLEKLLARLAPLAAQAGDAAHLNLPCEREWARACGLPLEDGRIPLAAWQLRQDGGEPGGSAWAWLTPCHWRVAQDHIAMDHPEDLDLGEDESRALLQAMQPYFEEDGIRVRYASPTRWLAEGEIFRSLATASLDRVSGHLVDHWLPRAAEARVLRRLQQEMQMLLYTHAVNEARTEAGKLPVNSFWASGAGALPPGAPAKPPAGLRVATTLRAPALAQDAAGWAAAWREVDGAACASLLAELEAGRDVALTLCGEQYARTWGTSGAGILRRLASTFSRRRIPAVLESL